MMNIFQLPSLLPAEEIFETLVPGCDVSIERIISCGQITPEGQWYDQERDEWVVLLQGKAEIDWEDGHNQKLDAGDWLLIPARAKHRVAYTSLDPPCIWLAVHARFSRME
jgi:cupin 2 domain-containing protein